MSIHYSQPKGFVGRSICYAIKCDGYCYGHIVGGSSTLHLPGRNEFFGMDKTSLNNVVNNVFYHVTKINGKYPIRNFTTKILLEFEKEIQQEWYYKYRNLVIGLESLVELPRTGECYIKAGWELVGQTVGYTCKRTSDKLGIGSDSWHGKRVWNTDSLKPKLVFVKKV